MSSGPLPKSLHLFWLVPTIEEPLTGDPYRMQKAFKSLFRTPTGAVSTASIDGSHQSCSPLPLTASIDGSHVVVLVQLPLCSASAPAIVRVAYDTTARSRVQVPQQTWNILPGLTLVSQLNRPKTRLPTRTASPNHKHVRRTPLHMCSPLNTYQLRHP
jgi:hypothetical protein